MERPASCWPWAERAVLALVDENGQVRATLGVGTSGRGLFLFDETGKTIWSQP